MPRCKLKFIFKSVNILKNLSNDNETFLLIFFLYIRLAMINILCFYHTPALPFLSLDTLPPNVKFMNFEKKEERKNYKELPLQSSNKSHHSS